MNSGFLMRKNLCWLLCCVLFSSNIFAIEPQARGNGVVFLVPYAQASPSSAKPLEFQKIDDHTGYFIVTDTEGKKRQISRGLVVFSLNYSDLLLEKDLSTAEELQAHLREAAKIRSIVSQIRSASFLQKYIDQLAEKISRHQNGELYVKGQWIDRDNKIKEEVGKIKQLFSEEIGRVDDIDNFEISNSLFYIRILELEKEHDFIAQQQVSNDLRNAVKLESQRRKAVYLNSKLNAGVKTYKQGSEIVSQIKSIEGKLPPEVLQSIQKWNQSEIKLAQLKKEFEKIALSIGNRFANATPSTLNSIFDDKEFEDLAKIHSFLNNIPKDQYFPFAFSDVLESCVTLKPIRERVLELQKSIQTKKPSTALVMVDRLRDCDSILGPAFAEWRTDLRKELLVLVQNETQLKKELEYAISSSQPQEAKDIANKLKEISSDPILDQFFQ